MKNTKLVLITSLTALLSVGLLALIRLSHIKYHIHKLSLDVITSKESQILNLQSKGELI